MTRKIIGARLPGQQPHEDDNKYKQHFHFSRRLRAASIRSAFETVRPGEPLVLNSEALACVYEALVFYSNKS